MKTAAFIGLGVVLACVIGALHGLATVRATSVDDTPVEIMVAERDVEAGAVVTSVRAVVLPGTWVTESMIRASEWPRVQRRPLSFALVRGDALTWQHFARAERVRATDQCVRSLNRAVEDAVKQRLDAELAAMEVPALVPTPTRRPPAGQTVRVLVAASDLRAGAKLEASSLRAIDLPGALLTESLVLEQERESIIDATLDSEVQAGDVIWWQMLRRDEVLGANTCTAKLSALARQVRQEQSARLVATFKEAP